MHKPQLIEYIRQQVSVGVPKEDIVRSLIANGWEESDIHAAFASMANAVPVPHPSGLHTRGNLAPLGKLLRDSWQLYKRRLPILAALLAVPYAFFFIAISLVSASDTTVATVGMLSLLIGFLISVPAAPAVVLAAAKGTGFAESYQQGLRLALPFLWFEILLGLVIMGGSVLFIIPALLMSIWFLFGTFTFVLEGKRGLQALLQSREYVRGYWWALFGRALVLYAVAIVPVYLVQFLITTVSASVGYALMALSYAILLLVAPFFMVYTYELYKNLTALKPYLVSTTPTSGRGFLIASAILGLLFPIIIILVGFALLLVFF
ncbi:MAG: hypothetical protein ACHQU0_02955 [Candidatus Paceibacteria bacterium]